MKEIIFFLFFSHALFISFLSLLLSSSPKKEMTDADPNKPTEDKAAAAADTEASAAAPAPAAADAVATLEGDDLFDEFGERKKE